MDKEFLHFEKINRETWQNCTAKPPHHSLKQSSILLKVLTTASTSRMSWRLPAFDKPDWNLQAFQRRFGLLKRDFSPKTSERQPFIIGVSGSVAVGKSTTSRLLQILLSRTFEGSTVELVTTDGFLYPNAILNEQELLNRKGFPESYDMELLLDFLQSNQKQQKCRNPCLFPRNLRYCPRWEANRFYQLILSL